MMVGLDSILPSDEWQTRGIHWHAFTETRPLGANRAHGRGIGDRVARLDRQPDTVLRTPYQVAEWLDAQTRVHVERVETWTTGGEGWVRIGDEDDLAHVRRQNFLIASRGDSIYSDVFSRSAHFDLFVEAVTDAECCHGCTATS